MVSLKPSPGDLRLYYEDQRRLRISVNIQKDQDIETPTQPSFRGLCDPWSGRPDGEVAVVVIMIMRTRSWTNMK